jgi:hypothetical protein
MILNRPHRVAVLALPGVIPLELGIAAEIFGRDPHYRLTVCAEGRSVSLPDSGLTVNTPAGLEGLKRAETVVIPGYVRHTLETPDSYRSAQPRLPSQRLVSSTTVPPRPTGGGPTSSRTATPGSTCCPTASSSTTAMSSRRPV